MLEALNSPPGERDRGKRRKKEVEKEEQGRGKRKRRKKDTCPSPLTLLSCPGLQASGDIYRTTNSKMQMLKSVPDYL